MKTMEASGFDREYYLALFTKELRENLLPFWMRRCLDTEHGGYYNCFSNDGARLLGRDKYTWSMGRFVWIFSRLSLAKGTLFDEAERRELLRYAENGRLFLEKHVFLRDGELRCVFLTDEEGMRRRFPTRNFCARFPIIARTARRSEKCH